MDMFKAKLITLLVAFTFVCAAILGALLFYVFPQFYPGWYFEIVFFFLILETALISFIESVSRKTTSRKMVNMYMLTKVVKMLLSLIFITIYVLVVKENIKNFVLTFIIFYVLSIVMETFLFSKIEKRLKESNNQLL
ncbi:hypothetical protein D0T53_10690 [Dysgonomonas sp. 216]|uniref:hypothetical protein n=1 Tax=Dysgonomonas sp. 216 TaxID=2302934 RepID=UPI0013D1288F|nr:hypothetical protein [Dysgonomonas sp. 216]NDW19375.1 hypothetical protein [Dysgonomonas sp. 216]